MHAHHHVCPSCRGAGTVSAAAAAVTPAPRRRGLFSSSRRKRSVTTAQASSTGGDDGELKFRRFLSLEAAAVSKTPLSSSFSIPLLSLTHTRTPMKRRNRNDGLNDDNDKRSICVSLHYFAPGRIARRRRIWPLVAHRGAVCSLEGLCRRRGLSSRRGRGARQVPRVRRDGRHALRYVSELETEGKENRAADRFFRKKKKNYPILSMSTTTPSLIPPLPLLPHFSKNNTKTSPTGAAAPASGAPSTASARKTPTSSSSARSATAAARASAASASGRV